MVMIMQSVGVYVRSLHAV